jgi:hypothetical protein
MTIKSLTLNNSGGAELNDTIKISETYNPSLGLLTTNSKLILLSTNTNTAKVTAGDAMGFYISGVVQVQRYIPGKRAWRLLSSPITSNGIADITLQNSWQNSTLITGPSGTGLDATTPRYSFQRYDDVLQDWVNINNTTTTTLCTNDANASSKGFAAFIYGNRNPNNVPIPNFSNTTLSATGNLLQGTQNFNAGMLNANDYHLIGNPYASPVDLNQVFLNAGTNNINRTFYTWDPQIGGTNGTGGYITISYNAGSGTYDIIPTTSTTHQTTMLQSGQAFFVQAAATAATNISFEENDKTNNNINTVFGVSNGRTDKLSINLIENNSGLLTTKDGILATYNNVFSKAVNFREDAEKLFNNEEIIMLKRSGKDLCIERRPYITNTNDTLFIALANIKAGSNYQFEINPQNWDTLCEAYLVDNVLNTQTPISLYSTNTIAFTSTTKTITNRFYVVLKHSNPLPTTNVQLTAKLQNNKGNISWTVSQEQGIQTYNVQRSHDGKTFETIATQASIGKGKYSIVDNTIKEGINYYRIQMLQANAEAAYSNTVTLTLETKNVPMLTVYPNPINANSTLQLSHITKGNYTLNVYTADGKMIAQKAIQVNESNKAIELDFIDVATLASGVYTLQVQGNNSVAQIKLIKN